MTIQGRHSDEGLEGGQRSGLDLRRGDNSINLGGMEDKEAHTIGGTVSDGENMWYMMKSQHTQHGWR